MVTTTVTRREHQVTRAHYVLSSLRNNPEALLRLTRQGWSVENEWHWPRDTQLHEHAHRNGKRNGAPLCSSLRMVVMNLLRIAASDQCTKVSKNWVTTTKGYSHSEAWSRGRLQ
jgi:predicted transposase YbfD/YdcC